MSGILFIVATPIGNLSDITLRALEVLKSVDLIAAEDTRQTKKLLDRYQITTKSVSFREAAPRPKIEQAIAEIIQKLQSGQSVAYVSDAGTPGVADPGQYLVQRVAQANLPIAPIPGPSALTASLSVAGFSCQKVLFLGFLPKKKGRQTLMKNLAIAAGKSFDTIVFYENQNRLIKTLEEIAHYFDTVDRVVVCREMTKIYEEIVRGSISEIITYFKENPQKLKGEFTVVISVNLERSSEFLRERSFFLSPNTAAAVD